MNEPSKTPFEPIPMPGMPEMPALPEMPRPSFSRTSTPPATPPLQRRPLMVADDKPNPFLLPPGIASEAPTPPVPAPASGSKLSWLRPSRAKGVIVAGLGSLGIGAFGLNALFPVPADEPSKVNAFADTSTLATNKSTPTPQIVEERPVGDPPGLMPRVVLETNDEPWNKPPTPPITLVVDTTPLPVPTALPTIPSIPAAIPSAPASIAPVPTALPPVLLPGSEEKPRPIQLPVKTETLPEAKIEPTPLKLESPTPEPKLPGVIPIPEPKVPVVVPVPVPDLKPTPPAEPARTNIELKPFPEYKAEPPALPVPGALPKSIAPATVEAKTDYDVDIHKLRAGDSYSAISQKFYGSAAYATALRGYNDNADLTRLRDVQVPPIHIIKRFGGSDAPRVIPVGVMEDPRSFAPSPVENSVEWGSPGARKPDKPTSGEPVWR